MGMRTRIVRLQYSQNDGAVRSVEERRRRGLRQWVGPERIYRPRQDSVVCYRRRRDFISRYHLTPECVLWLADKSAAHHSYMTHGDIRGRRIPILQKVCLALRHLASGATYGVIRDTHGGCSTSSVQRSVQEFVAFLVSTAHRYVRFPKKSELPAVTRGFQTKFEINDVVGLVDGTYVPILCPVVNEWAFVCRKNYHALNVLVIYDSNGRLTAVDSSFTGSQHDQFVWNMSLIDSRINHHNRYMLILNVMTPYHHTTYADLTVPEKDFHDLVVTVRSFVERTMGHWKISWRILSRFGADVIKATRAAAGRLVIAAACLHNIAIDWETPTILPSEQDPDLGDDIRVDAERVWAQGVAGVCHGQQPANQEVEPIVATYASGALHRAEILYRDFGEPNPALNANLARARRRHRLRLDIINN